MNVEVISDVTDALLRADYKSEGARIHRIILASPAIPADPGARLHAICEVALGGRWVPVNPSGGREFPAGFPKAVIARGSRDGIPILDVELPNRRKFFFKVVWKESVLFA